MSDEDGLIEFVKMPDVDVTVDNRHIHHVEEKSLPPHARLDKHIIGGNPLVRFVDATHVRVVVADHLGLLDQLHHPPSSHLTPPPANGKRHYKYFVIHCLPYVSNK